jgi:hypothetical protein
MMSWDKIVGNYSHNIISNEFVTFKSQVQDWVADLDYGI